VQDPEDGSGVLVVNPPWQVDAALTAAMPALAELLGEPGRSGAGASSGWSVSERRRAGRRAASPW
jgi:23S rRNA A2030 N6-methylase RlmJ